MSSITPVGNFISVRNTERNFQTKLLELNGEYFVVHMDESASGVPELGILTIFKLNTTTSQWDSILTETISFAGATQFLNINLEVDIDGNDLVIFIRSPSALSASNTVYCNLLRITDLLTTPLIAINQQFSFPSIGNSAQTPIILFNSASNQILLYVLDNFNLVGTDLNITFRRFDFNYTTLDTVTGPVQSTNTITLTDYTVVPRLLLGGELDNSTIFWSVRGVGDVLHPIVIGIDYSDMSNDQLLSPTSILDYSQGITAGSTNF
jgi:hypothetical protein